MNDDYLWQKTGEDPQTKELENLLTVFRYREDDPPAIPIADEFPTRRWRFSLALAAPAIAALVIAFAIWFGTVSRLDDDEVTFVNETPAIVEQPAPDPHPDPSPVAQPSAMPKRPVRRTEIQRTFAGVRHKPAATTRPPKADVVALTAEEQYAYQQLMLALSISSSKLNIVRNAINGVEDTKNDSKQNNR